MKVCKFGGTSLANAAQMEKVAAIVTADPERRIVIVSAPGKRASADTKVTDLLIQCAEARLKTGEIAKAYDQVVERFAEIQRDIQGRPEIVDEIAADLKKRLESDTSHPAKFTDTIKAAGEDYSARMFAEVLRAKGHEAHYINPQAAGLLLSDEFGNAMVLPESYQNLAALKNAPGISVFPGFFGYTRGGAIATFPRGGSDISGAILAAAVHADLYENFTDVDSVFSADPRIIENPRSIEELTYREMRELSYAGFGVFHEEAIQPAIDARIPICIKNTNRPEAPGTRVIPEAPAGAHNSVTGIASSTGFCTVFVEKYLMNRMVGFGRKFLQIFEDEALAFQHMPSGIDNISIILRNERMTPEIEKRVLDRIGAELKPDSIEIEHGLTLIMIVGEGMRHSIGVAGRATTALARAGVNIEMINQGSSEISMMFGVKDEDRPKAIKGLYEEFFLKK